MNILRTILLFHSLSSIVRAHPGARLPSFITTVESRPIHWTGRIFITDTVPTTLNGSIQEIYSRILSLNPKYIASEVNPVTDPPVRSLNRRNDVVNCAVMATGSRSVAWSAYGNLKAAGGTCGANAGQCSRMTCDGSTATYVCSESGDVAQSCDSLADMIVSVINGCCSNDAAVSGSVYRDGAFSIWVGYGNCDIEGSTRPSDFPYGGGGGVNGACY